MTARVLVLALGGTIASVPSDAGAGGGAVPTLTAEDLLAAVPGLAEVAQVEARTVAQKASCDITPQDVRRVVEEAAAAFADGVAGVVVTQGTDTLEETAYLLDLWHAGPETIVVTGAMRTPTSAGADGPPNLLAAVRVAASEAARDLGALAVFADEIHAARHVAKSHVESIAGFASPGLGPLGRVSEGHVRIDLRPAQRTQTFPVPEGAWPRVPILRVAQGTDVTEIEALASVANGLVVEGVGGGHVPSPTVAALEAIAGRIPVVLASRIGAGGTLSSTYGYPGSELDLLARGLLSAGPLDALKARLRLAAQLAADEIPHNSV